MPTWPLWAVCFGLVVLRGLLATVESALYGLSDMRARELTSQHPRRGPRLSRLKTEREATAASLRFGMVLSGFTAAAIGAQVPPRLVGESLLRIYQDSGTATWLAPLASAVGVALLAMLVELAFRASAAANPEGWALRLSGLASATVTLLYPLMRLLVLPLNVLLAPFDAKVRFEAPAPPLEEIEQLLAARAGKEGVDKSAPQLIRSIFELSDKTCRDVMVPRTEVIAVDLATPPTEILTVLAEESHSRIPVYQDDIDHLVGILHVRDLVPLMQHPELIVLHDLVRPAVFVPWMKPVGDLLRDMQRQKIHMAAVVDEHGGFMGIVTLEDILREIVGDIGDEFDVDLRQVERQSDGSFLVDAHLPSTEVEAALGLKLPEGEFETLGGYLSSLSGSIPDVGDKVTVQGWTLAVHSKDGPKLGRLRVVRPRPSGPGPVPSAPRT